MHRDIKAENVLIDKEYLLVKLTDFGLACIASPETCNSEPVGTLAYAAPEILIRQPYTYMVDNWSLGVVLYFMLYGILPFNNQSEIKLVKQIVETEPDWDVIEIS